MIQDSRVFKFQYGDVVVPIGADTANRFNSSDTAAGTHIGHCIKVMGRATARLDGIDLINMYKAAGCWYAEEDLMLKEEYQQEKRLARIKVEPGLLDGLIGWKE